MARIIGPLVMVLLASGVIIGVAYALTPPADAQRSEPSFISRIVKRPATSHSEEILKNTIEALQRGQPDYSRMSPKLSNLIRSGLPRQQPKLVALGPLQSIAYLGGTGPQMDIYRAAFANGSLFWAISVTPAGVTQGLGFFNTEPLKPRDWIDNYSSFPFLQRMERLGVQLGILLAAAFLGRLALRLRL